MYRDTLSAVALQVAATPGGTVTRDSVEWA